MRPLTLGSCSLETAARMIPQFMIAGAECPSPANACDIVPPTARPALASLPDRCDAQGAGVTACAARINGAEGRIRSGTMFPVAGLAPFAASVIVGSDGLLGAANLVIGISIQLSGPAWGGAISTMLGLLLLGTWRNRRRRRQRGIAALGAKSRALRERLARRMAERTIPVPA